MLRRPLDPPLALDVEVETPDGFFRLPSDSRVASKLPQGLTFGTQRGDGFATGTLTLAREIFKDYPDVGLLDTWRYVNKAGDVIYEGRLASNPRSTRPAEQIDVKLVGWMTYLRSRKVSPLIVDRSLEGWGGPSNQRRGEMLAMLRRFEGAVSTGWQDAGAKAQGVIFAFERFDAFFYETGEAWKYFGGEDIGSFRADFDEMAGGGSSTWETRPYLCADDIASSYDAGADTEGGDAAGQVLASSAPGRKYVLLYHLYTGSFEGTGNSVQAWLNPRVHGSHGIQERGSSPDEYFYLSDVIAYILATYYPKLRWAGLQNTTRVEQASWAGKPEAGYDIVQALNKLALWETNVFEDRTFYFESADLTVYDWEIDTDEAGVEAVLEGDSIEDFANGVSVTYTDFNDVRHVLYPPDHAELRDESESNPANRHNEYLWTDVEMPNRGTFAEALQFGRAYLAEYNRPKRPGTYTVYGYIRDGSRHWHPAYNVRNSQTLGIKNHPDDAPRLITSTLWNDKAKILTITVDAPDKVLDAVVARQEQARAARNQ